MTVVAAEALEMTRKRLMLITQMWRSLQTNSIDRLCIRIETLSGRVGSSCLGQFEIKNLHLFVCFAFVCLFFQRKQPCARYPANHLLIAVHTFKLQQFWIW